MFYENYWLTNVTLESSFAREGDLVVKTNAEVCNIRICGGKVAEILPGSDCLNDELPRVDGEGLLALPPFYEMHCHPDKTFLTGAWAAPRAVNIKEIIEKESDLLASIDSETMKTRANKMFEMMKDAGSLFIRAHADVHDKVQLKNLKAAKEALNAQEGLIGHELVAFPQCGILKGNALDLMREALQNGADIIGGIDPHYVEGDPDKALGQIVALAAEYDAGIDIHLHETGEEGLYSVGKLAELTIEAGRQGRVSISHAFALGSASEEEVSRIAEQLKEAQIDIITCGLVSDPIPKIALLQEKGVRVRLGSDNIHDSWNPFGNGDILERLGRVIQVFEWYDEYSLSRSLKLITDGVTPLSDDGERVWPKPGDDATMVLVDASCSAEAIARRAARKKFLVRGAVR